MKRFLIAITAIMLVAVMGVPAWAGTQDNAVLALHVAAHAKGDPCANDPVLQAIPCSDYVTQGDLNTSYDVYLVIAEGVAPPGVAALSCGILYNNGDVGAATTNDGSGVDMFAWTLCTSGLEFPNGTTGQPEDEWPASGGGNRITWDQSTDCEVTVVGDDGVQATAGAFYVYAYSDDFLAITENVNLQSGPEMQVGDCNSAVTDIPYPAAAGNVRFSAGAATQGCNPCLGPCDAVPTASTTWGKIKQQYD